MPLVDRVVCCARSCVSADASLAIRGNPLTPESHPTRPSCPSAPTRVRIHLDSDASTASSRCTGRGPCSACQICEQQCIQHQTPRAMTLTAASYTASSRLARSPTPVRLTHPACPTSGVSPTAWNCTGRSLRAPVWPVLVLEPHGSHAHLSDANISMSLRPKTVKQTYQCNLPPPDLSMALCAPWLSRSIEGRTAFALYMSRRRGAETHLACANGWDKQGE
ncbi:hypothetical protein K466DRAFT_414040 [Polyporus arcularius HHB13444]|uniref:Uncharacterized protein n=1 Tax=Polyporus arcularius HHB13444 TaxID=1314778 RepID=A0A5C3NQX7_9APHY|nr:hypothetical protein K466DRAFT_414040 [Polyporus arcularius HHB13444]